MQITIQPSWPAPTTVKAYTTLRSLHVTAKQTTALTEALQLPSPLLLLDQKHTNIALPAVSENHGQIGDALFTDRPGRVCSVLTADCLPVFICNREGTRVAVAHAGWRGLASGIIESTLAALSIPADETLVWLGPAISQKQFEVGQDVYDAFIQYDPSAIAAFIAHKSGKWMADLYLLAKQRLAAKGIEAIYGGDYCTYTQDDLFFSYRREKENPGRLASLIWFDAK